MHPHSSINYSMCFSWSTCTWRGQYLFSFLWIFEMWHLNIDYTIWCINVYKRWTKSFMHSCTCVYIKKIISFPSIRVLILGFKSLWHAVMNVASTRFSKNNYITWYSSHILLTICVSMSIYTNIHSLTLHRLVSTLCV